MTVGVAFRSGSRTLIGADRRWADTESGAREIRPPSKIIQVGSLVFVFAGSGRVYDMLRVLAPPKPPADADYTWVVTKLIPLLTAACDGYGVQSSDHELLLCAGRHLYRIDETWSCAESEFQAVGSGASAASAAWLALEGIRMPARERLERILKASESNCFVGDGRDVLVLPHTRAR